MGIKDFGFVFWIHLIIILFLWASPFLLNWKIIVLGIIIYYLQLLIFGDCVLTRKQFKTNHREMTLYTHVLEKIGFNVNRKLMVFLADFIFPWVILGISLVLQLGFGFRVIIF